MSNKWLSDFDLQRCDGSGDTYACARRVVTGAVTPPPLLSTQEDGVCRIYMYIKRYFSVADIRTRVAVRQDEATASQHKTRLVRAPIKGKHQHVLTPVLSAVKYISCNIYFIYVLYTTIEKSNIIKNFILRNATRSKHQKTELCFFIADYLINSSAPKMDAIISPETSVRSYRATCPYILFLAVPQIQHLYSNFNDIHSFVFVYIVTFCAKTYQMSEALSDENC